MPGKRALYDQDFYAWANKQASLLHAGKLSEADIEQFPRASETAPIRPGAGTTRRIFTTPN